MSFVQGFEKTAAMWNPMTGVGQIGKGVQAAGKAIGGAAKAVGEKAKNLLAGGKASRMEGFRGKPTGEALTKARMNKNFQTGNLKPLEEVSAQSRLDLAKRKSRMDDFKANKAKTEKTQAAAAAEAAKPKKRSFAMRHPIITGMAGIGAYKAITSDGSQQQQQQPPVVYQPQGY